MQQLATENNTQQLDDLMDVTGRYSSWEKYITTCQARDIFTPIKNVLKVNTTDSIKTVLAAMFSYKLKCFPVYDPDNDKYRAFVDVHDIVEYILNIVNKATKKHDIKLPTDNGQVVISHELAELDIPVGQAMNFSQENFLFMLPAETLMREILYVMGPGAKHRLWIYNDAHNTGAGMITQTKLLQCLEEDLLHFPDIGKKTIESLGLVKSDTQILSVSLDTRVKDAFKMLTDGRVQALAILNQDGNLENEFSSNDVKALSLFGEFFENLNMKISEYFEKLQQYCTRARNPPVCHKNDSLLHVMHLLTSHRAHHLFVMEDDPADKKPNGLPEGLGLGPELGLGLQQNIQEINGYQVGNGLLGGSESYEAQKPVCVITVGDVIRALWQFSEM